MSGWIKLHRSLLEWEWYDDVNVMRLFLHCILKANHKDKKHKGTLVLRGSFLTGFDVLSKETGLSVRQVRTALTKLESTSEVTRVATSKGQAVTVVNYNKYQNDDRQATSGATSNMTNQRQATDKPTTTNKNEKKERMEETNTPTQTRIGKLVKRRESTKWNDKENTAFRKLNPTEEDIAFLESKKYADHPYRRRDLITLLNNWGGELDRMNTPEHHTSQNVTPVQYGI